MVFWEKEYRECATLTMLQATVSITHMHIVSIRLLFSPFIFGDFKTSLNSNRVEKKWFNVEKIGKALPMEDLMNEIEMLVCTHSTQQSVLFTL